MTGHDATEAARQLAARRKRGTFACEVCGREYEALDRPKQQPRTCSPACRQKAFRERRKHQPA